ncbi:hypothetical protein MKS88_000388 [Plasmodium brasilianum]|uniref:Uncharacterized protein n=1 Tax=Plasmodium brasilianum TaxID=5824 RepID=A0ACB9YF02_PLABR|nr:hypothetical protein MKS88_000388 [Plasmodium brasilianum]
MDNCITSYSTFHGLTVWSYVVKPTFKAIQDYIQNKTSTLKNEKNKQTFRQECLGLADYLINKKVAPRYENQTMWELALKHWLKRYYNNLTNHHGGCPMILEQKDKEILQLKYQEEDFCDKRRTDLNQIKALKKNYPSNCTNEYLMKCREYKEWLEDRKFYFEKNKNLFKHCYKTKKKSTCNIMDEETFKEPPECSSSYIDKNCNFVSEKKVSDTQMEAPVKDQDLSTPHAENEGTHAPDETDNETKQQIYHDSQTQLQESSSFELLDEQRVAEEIPGPSSAQEETSIPNTGTKNKYQVTQVDPALPKIVPESEESPPDNAPSSPTLSVLPSRFPLSSKLSKIPGIIKKKNKIKRRHVKFLRLLVPSFSKHKSKFLTDDLLEHPIFDEKEIVKKIKINEFKKNINLSNRKKDRSKTIIEVHMEVLEECRNEEWENNKEEFLKICIDEITKKEYNVYSNLTNDDLITQNIKSSNDIPKQNILWNKWIERHRYISEKLKKMDWFNNLKNEWKEELAYMKEMVKLKIKSSNENHKVLFLEREKDIWKQWISKKGTIIEQYLEQECFNEFSEDFHNISDEYLNEDTKNYVSLMNIEEFQIKENYEEFYKYVKRKLVRKLFILVFMTILEECKNEVNFENSESYFDSSLNELKKRLSSDKIPEITENIIEYSSNDLGYRQNKEIHAHIGNDSFRNEIENLIREDNKYGNYVVNYGALDKYDEIEEKQIL